MQTTPNLGMVIPSGDGDPFDEMAYSNALVVVDTFAGHVADKTAAATQVFAGNLQSPTINATVGYQVNGAALAAANVVNAADKSSAAAQAFTGAITSASQFLTPAGGPSAVGGATGVGIYSTGLGIFSNAAATGVIYVTVPADTQYRLVIDSNGKLSWGSGAAAADVVLERWAPGGLRVTNGGLLCSGPTAGIGYATGAGGAVTQATSFNTGVTLNKVCGTITLFTSATVAGTVSTFTVTNSTVSAGDTVNVCWGSGGSANNGLLLAVSAVASGSFTITWYSVASNASATRTINFAVVKAVSA